MWHAKEHSDDTNILWSWIRAIEWINWPIFVTQPIMPVLLYLYPMSWDKLVIGLIILNVAWHVSVPKRFVSVHLADFGSVFVHLKWISCPTGAYLIWGYGHPYHAIAALLWPIAVLVIQTAVNVPLGLLFRTTDIGPIQDRFMLRLGYIRSTK